MKHNNSYYDDENDDKLSANITVYTTHFNIIKTKYLDIVIYYIAALVSCAINAAIYSIAAFILFYCTRKKPTLRYKSAHQQ